MKLKFNQSGYLTCRKHGTKIIIDEVTGRMYCPKCKTERQKNLRTN